MALTATPHKPRGPISIPELSLLEKNLSALGATSLAAANRIAAASPRESLNFTPTPSGHTAATITEWGLTGTITRALASKRDPQQEAARLVEKVDVLATPLVVVVGFGLGYHVAELARKLGRHGMIVVFEPDVELLRAVFDRFDFSEWLSKTNLLLLTDPDDEGAMADALRGLEGVIAMGVQVLEHPASQARLGDAAAGLGGGGGGGGGGGTGPRFVQRFTRIVKAARTTVVTTMVQTEGALRNVTQNLDVYAASPGITDLANIAAGRPAIVVSAGPSLRRNIELLAQPGMRDRFVIIAVQTVLKPLLARGIRPHFVTALDFHQISRRFYEGLTEDDARDTTLVIEPKVNPAVPPAFPGNIRCVSDHYLDRLLGPQLSRPMGALPPGATVAHLAYYLARHLGCDPVVLVGQDLGFTDGQYYSAGAAIHGVWAGELNEFNTLEMLEWQRIVRMRGQLRRETDVLGRSIYTDEQMSTYLVQFQRDFKADADRGLTTIDATEGGVSKNHTVCRPLADVIAQFGGRGERPIVIPHVEPIGTATRRATLSKVTQRVRDVRQDVWKVGKACRQAKVLLEEMLAHQADQPRVNRLIQQVEDLRDNVSQLEPAFGLVQTLNQTGAFNRQKTDRRIYLGKSAGDLTAMQVQREQIDRDLTNVTWLGDAAEAMGAMLEECVAACEGKPKRTRDPVREDDQPIGSASDRSISAVKGGQAAVRAVITLDPAFSGLGVRRDLAHPSASGRNALQLTLARLARCRKLAGVTIVTSDPAAATRLVGQPPSGLDVQIRQAQGAEPGLSPAAARAARLWSADCWRGGLGNLTCYDEALWPAAALAALEESSTDAALLLSADWGLIDPALCDALIERYQELPLAHRVTFTQAAPGLVGCIVDRTMLTQMAQRRAAVGSFASIGGVLGYVPTAPAPDFIVKPMCLAVDPAVRDALHRCTLDSPARSAAIFAALAQAALDPLTASAAQIAAAVSAWWSDPSRDRPRHITLRVIDASGAMKPDTVATTLRQLGPWAALSTITLAGEASLAQSNGPDALDHPAWQQLVAAARESGIGAVQIRTTLRCDEAALDALISTGSEVISVDLVADDPTTYLQLTGRDDFGRVRANLQRLLAARPAPGPGGIASPWVVARITRRDAVYEQIESFYDYWTLIAGSAVIDPLPAPVSGERIDPLPLPPLAARRRALTHVCLPPLP